MLFLLYFPYVYILILLSIRFYKSESKLTVPKHIRIILITYTTYILLAFTLLAISKMITITDYASSRHFNTTRDISYILMFLLSFRAVLILFIPTFNLINLKSKLWFICDKGLKVILIWAIVPINIFSSIYLFEITYDSIPTSIDNSVVSDDVTYISVHVDDNYIIPTIEVYLFNDDDQLINFYSDVIFSDESYNIDLYDTSICVIDLCLDTNTWLPVSEESAQANDIDGIINSSLQYEHMEKIYISQL